MAGFNFMTGYNPYMSTNFGMNYNNNSSGLFPMFRETDYFNPSNYFVPNCNTSYIGPTPPYWPVNGDSFGPNTTIPPAAPKPVKPATGGKNDTKLSFWDKVKNFGKGLISPITTMFSSPGNFLRGAAMIIGGAALIAITGGAAAPIMVAAGVTMGAYNIGKGAIRAMKATTREEAEAAWQQMGGGTAAVGLSVLGAKSALKTSGTTPTGGFVNSTVQCFKATPRAFGQSFTNAKALLGAGTSTGATPTGGPKTTNEPPRGSTTSEPPPKSPNGSPAGQRAALPEGSAQGEPAGSTPPPNAGKSAGPTPPPKSTPPPQAAAGAMPKNPTGWTADSIKNSLYKASNNGGNIKSLFQKIAKEIHPDNVGGYKDVGELMDALTTTYDYLKNSVPDAMAA